MAFNPMVLFKLRGMMNQFSARHPKAVSFVKNEILTGLPADTVLEIETITGRHYDAVNIVGGGSKAGYLNKLTAEKSGRKVLAGPGEATAIGNLTAQMIRAGVFKDLKEARQNIFESFGVEVIEP